MTISAANTWITEQNTLPKTPCFKLGFSILLISNAAVTTETNLDLEIRIYGNGVFYIRPESSTNSAVDNEKKQIRLMLMLIRRAFFVFSVTANTWPFLVIVIE